MEDEILPGPNQVEYGFGNLEFLKENSRKLCEKSIFEEESIYKCYDRFLVMYF